MVMRRVEAGDRWSRLCGTMVVGGLVLLAPAMGAAQESAGDTEARGLFEAGRVHYEEGNYEAAYPEFQRAYELSHRAPLLLNIANTLERLGRYREATDALRGYLADAELDAIGRTRIETRITHLERRVAQGPVATGPGTAPPTEPVTATVTPPATPTSTAATPAAVPATAVTTAAPAAAPLPDRAPASHAGSLAVPAYVAFGVGAAGLVSFAVFGSLAMVSRSELTSAGHCGATGPGCSDAQVSDVRTMALVADISLGAAIVGGAVGAVLYAVGGSDSSSDDVAWLPVVDPSTVGLSARGSF